jgi:GNAT superfamily N-acetyltransferase
MIIERGSLFCDIALAGRVERAEAELIAEASEAARRRRGDAAGFVTPVAGGVASFAGPDSPFNKVAGLGFGGVPGAGDLAVIEQAFAARGAPVQVELSHLADPAVGNLLTGRGYRLVSYENVLGRALEDAPEPEAESAPPGVAVRLSAADELQVWLDVVVEAGLQPDTEGLPAEEFPREALEHAERDLVAASGTRRYLARRDGVAAGGASFRVAGGIAQFTGAATVPAHRRRGIQTALLAARLADAAAAGCDLAVITTSPGTKSQQNAQRQGFDLLYTRAILVKE